MEKVMINLGINKLEKLFKSIMNKDISEAQETDRKELIEKLHTVYVNNASKMGWGIPSKVSFNNAADIIIRNRDNKVHELEIVIKGIPPKPAGRPRARVIFKNGKPMATVYPDPKDKDYRKAMDDFFRDFIDINMPDFNPICGEIHTHIVFYMPLPKANKFLHILANLGIYRPLGTPDNDNLMKLFLDCQQGLLFANDSQFTTTLIEKYYAIEPKIVYRLQYRERAFWSSPKTK